MVSHLFVVIIKCRFDFPMVAMGEPDPYDEPHPRNVRYTIKVGRGASHLFVNESGKNRHGKILL